MTTTVSAMRTENIRLIHEMTVPVKPKDLTDDEPSALRQDGYLLPIEIGDVHVTCSIDVQSGEVGELRGTVAHAPLDGRRGHAPALRGRGKRIRPLCVRSARA